MQVPLPPRAPFFCPAKHFNLDICEYYHLSSCLFALNFAVGGWQHKKVQHTQTLT